MNITEEIRGMPQILRFMITLTPMFAIGLILDSVLPTTKLETGIALAIYTSEIQMFATLAALTPLFFTFAQIYRRDDLIVRRTISSVIGMMSLSLLGVVVCIGYILRRQFDMFSVIFPLLVLLEFVILMSLFLLSYAGFESAQAWLG